MSAIDLPFIEVNVSRHGSVRYYVRMKGKRLGRLPDNPGDPAFTKNYWMLRKGLKPHDDKPEVPVVARVQKDTFAFLCREYQASMSWKRLDPATQNTRRHLIEEMLREPLTKAEDETRLFRDMPIEAMTLENLTVLRDRKEHLPFAADTRVKLLRQIMATMKPDGQTPYCSQNTAKLLAKFNKKTDGYHTIRDHELKQFIEHHGVESKAVLALGLLMYTGVRASDLRAIGPKNRKGSQLTFRVFKGRQRHPQDLTLEVHPALDVILARHKFEGPTYLLTERGESFSRKGMSNKVSDWFTEAKLPHCSAHSVRKGLATNLAESEATDKMLDHMFGWSGGKTSQIYTRKVEQARVARQAVSRINWDVFDELSPPSEIATPVSDEVPGVAFSGAK